MMISSLIVHISAAGNFRGFIRAGMAACAVQIVPPDGSGIPDHAKRVPGLSKGKFFRFSGSRG